MKQVDEVGTQTPKKGPPISPEDLVSLRAYVRRRHKVAIEAAADAAGLDVSAYLRVLLDKHRPPKPRAALLQRQRQTQLLALIALRLAEIHDRLVADRAPEAVILEFSAIALDCFTELEALVRLRRPSIAIPSSAVTEPQSVGHPHGEDEASVQPPLPTVDERASA